MSKDHHENILQEVEEEEEEGGVKEEEEECWEPREDAKEKEEEEEECLAAREDAKEKEECKTPTSSDEKIPSVRSCPPTPKKKVRPTLLLKRKRSELEFFETTRREEVESFFRSSSEAGSSHGFKRRCRSA